MDGIKLSAKYNIVWLKNNMPMRNYSKKKGGPKAALKLMLKYKLFADHACCCGMRFCTYHANLSKVNACFQITHIE